jgi:hypothetical protein
MKRTQLLCAETKLWSQQHVKVVTRAQPRRALKSVAASSSCASALGSGALRLAAGGFLVAASAGSSWPSPYAATCPQHARSLQKSLLCRAAPGSQRAPSPTRATHARQVHTREGRSRLRHSNHCCLSTEAAIWSTVCGRIPAPLAGARPGRVHSSVYRHRQEGCEPAVSARGAQRTPAVTASYPGLQASMRPAAARPGAAHRRAGPRACARSCGRCARREADLERIDRRAARGADGRIVHLGAHVVLVRHVLAQRARLQHLAPPARHRVGYG